MHRSIGETNCIDSADGIGPPRNKKFSIRIWATVLAKKIPINIQFLSRIKSNRVKGLEGSFGKVKKIFQSGKV